MVSVVDVPKECLPFCPPSDDVGAPRGLTGSPSGDVGASRGVPVNSIMLSMNSTTFLCALMLRLKDRSNKSLPMRPAVWLCPRYIFGFCKGLHLEETSRVRGLGRGLRRVTGLSLFVIYS